jgi:hypothetical protein
MAEPMVPPPPLSVRAQLLATEHWGLLAARGTAQNEVLTRISMFLTLVSAALVSLALVGQATDFSDEFVSFAIAVLGVVVLVGFLTQIRVFNVGMEDLMYVLAMNRLRGAYLEIDPGIESYLMASPHDDRAGSIQTYYFIGARSDASQVAGSSMIFIVAVNATVVGLFTAAVAGIVTASSVAEVVTGVACGAVYFTVSVYFGGRRYYELWKSYTPRFPSAQSRGT